MKKPIFPMTMTSLAVFMTASISSANVIEYDCSQGPMKSISYLNEPKSLGMLVGNDFRSIFKKIKTLNLDIDQSISTERLQDKILSLKTYAIPATDTIYGAGTSSFRLEAANYPGCLIASEDIFNDTKVNNHLILHEAMGALGYHDKNFEISSLLLLPEQTLKALNLAPPNKLSGYSTRKLKRATQHTTSTKQDTSEKDQNLILAGGGSVVGSGGDSILLSVKAQIFKTLVNQPLLDRQFKKVLLNKKQQQDFVEFIRNSSIDYLEEYSGYKNLGIANGVNQHMIASGLLRKPFAITVSTENNGVQSHLQFYKSEWFVLNQLSAFLQSESVRILDEQLTESDNLPKLQWYLTNMVTYNLEKDAFFKRSFEIEAKITSNTRDKEYLKNMKIKNISSRLFDIITKDQENLRSLVHSLDAESLKHLDEIVMLSCLYADFHTTEGAIDKYHYLQKSGKLESLKKDLKEIK